MYHLFFLILLFSPCGRTSTTTTSSWTASAPTNVSSSCVKREGTSFTLLSDEYLLYFIFTEYLTPILDQVAKRFPCVVREYTLVSLDSAETNESIFTDETDFATSITSLPYKDSIFAKLFNCNQSTLYGLKRALEISPAESVILVLTSGSMTDYNDTQLLSDVYSLIEKKQPQIYYLVFPACSISDPQQQIINNITYLTLGEFGVDGELFIAQDYPDIELLLSKPLNSSLRILNISVNVTSNYSTTFDILKTLSYLLITTDGPFTLKLIAPNGAITQVQNTQGRTHRIDLVKNPDGGNWLLKAFGDGQLTVKILGFTDMSDSGKCSASNCNQNATCEEFGGYDVQCTCKMGFTGDGYSCYDINECGDVYHLYCLIFGYNYCENTIGSYTCSCNAGLEYGFQNGRWGCTNIDACAIKSLNDCNEHASCTNTFGSYTCTCLNGYFGNGTYCEVNECQQGTPCPISKECIKYIGSYSCYDPCSNYTILNDPWRSTSNSLSSYGNNWYYYFNNCDYNLQGWYRFQGDNNQQIPDHCVPSYSCGTNAPMWMNGTYPSIEDGIVNRTACANWANNCCLWSNQISVISCPGGFYVYKLQGTPNRCLAYCTESNTNCSGIICASDEECQTVNGVSGCYCKNIAYSQNGWGSSNPTDYLTPKILCGLETIQLTFSKCLLQNLGYDTSAIHLIDNSCVGTIVRGNISYVSITTLPRSGYCSGSILINETTITYKNTVFLSSQHQGIERDDYAINFHCNYQKTLEINLLNAIIPYSGSATVDIGGTLNYTITMGLFQDSGYTIPLTSSYLSLSISTILYVGAVISGGTRSSNFVLDIVNCYATPTANTSDPTKYYIIQNGCPNTIDPTISIAANGVSLESRFSFQLFKFTGGYSQVYLHCQVGLCDTLEEQCQYSCPVSRLLKLGNNLASGRSLISDRSLKSNNILNIQTKDFTFGPLILKDSPTSGGDMTIPMAKLIITAFAFLALLY